MFKRIFPAVLAGLFLCGCSENETEQLTVSITSEMEYTDTSKAVISEEGIVDPNDVDLFELGGTYKETDETTNVSEENIITSVTETENTWSGFAADSEYRDITVDFELHPEITEDDMKQITELCKNNSGIRCEVRNAFMGELSFLSECSNISHLILRDISSGDDELIKAVSEMDSLEQIYITVNEYSDAFINRLFQAAPDCRIEYVVDQPLDSDKQFPNGYYDGFTIGVFSPIVRDNFHGVWFCNNTDEDVTVESAEVYYSYNDEWIPVAFSDGTFKKDIEFKAEMRYNLFYTNPYSLYDQPYDFQLNEDNFDFETAKTGRYKLVFKTDKGTAESDFCINNGTALNFLTDEQQEILKGADKIIGRYFSTSSYHPDEYDEGEDGENFIRETFCPYLTYELAYEQSLNVYVDENGKTIYGGGDRGSSIMYEGDYIQPVYVGDDMIIMKRAVVCSHSDFVSDFSLDAYNIQMVLTEDGWRVNRMYEYY